MFYIGLYRENIKKFCLKPTIFTLLIYTTKQKNNALFHEALSVRAVGSTSVSYI